MNNKESHIRQLLKRWISGDIKSQDEQRLDKAAQEDSFLREALAGLRSTAQNDHGQNITRLRQQLKTDKEKSKSIFLSSLRIAAAIALLLTAGWLLWTAPGFDTPENIAISQEVEPAVQKENNSDSLAQPTQTAPPEDTITPALTKKPKAQNNTPVANEKETLVIQDLPSPTTAYHVNLEQTASTPATATDKLLEEINEEKDTDVLNMEDEAADIVQTEEIAEGLTYAPPPFRVSNSGKPVAISGYRIIEGRITDSEGYPLIGANIIEKNTENNEISDLDGYFRIAVKKGNKTQLTCSYVGFENKDIQLGRATHYEIVLAENPMMLSEVTVTDLGVHRAKKSMSYSVEEASDTPDQKQMTVQPVGGYKALKDHIRQNTPAGAGRAKVRLHFIISPDGRPGNIRVLHSTNAELNDLAMELISSGPNWLITTGKEPVELEYLVKIR